MDSVLLFADPKLLRNSISDGRRKNPGFLALDNGSRDHSKWYPNTIVVPLQHFSFFHLASFWVGCRNMDVPATTEDVKESAESITVRVRDQVRKQVFSYSSWLTLIVSHGRTRAALTCSQPLFVELDVSSFYCVVGVEIVWYQAVECIYYLTPVVLERLFQLGFWNARREKKPFLKSRKRPRCRRSLKPTRLGKESKSTRCAFYLMGTVSHQIKHPRCSNWKIKIRLIASWSKREVKDTDK